MRSFAASLSIVLAASGPGLSHAQSPYPTRPVRLIVPYLAGGAPDIVARVLGQELASSLGQAFIVENRPGAGGSLATEYVVKAAPDGYTLLVTPDSPLTINPSVFKNLSYDPAKDLAPISTVASSSFFVVACPKSSANSIDDLVSEARTRRVTYASSGIGTIMHISGEAIRLRAGVNLTHVPYKGAPPAMADVMNCNVDFGFGAYGTVLPFIKSGKLKALAVSSNQRDPDLPAVPTVAEAGYPELAQLETPYGVLAPAGTPLAVVTALNTAIAAALKKAAVVEGFHKRGMVVATSTPEGYLDHIVSGASFIRDLVEKAGIEPQ